MVSPAVLACYFRRQRILPNPGSMLIGCPFVLNHFQLLEGAEPPGLPLLIARPF